MTQSQTKTAEKKISRVIKWLERCLSACRAGSLDGAFMDVECARAEFDAARDEIWCAAAQAHGKPRVARGAFVRVAFAVLIVVLLTASPLSSANYIEWVTPDEKALLTALRSRLSEENVGSVVVDVAEVAPSPLPASPSLRRPTGATSLREGGLKTAARGNVVFSPPPGGGTAAKRQGGVQRREDDAQILSLVNTAERALRKENSAVKVER